MTLLPSPTSLRLNEFHAAALRQNVPEERPIAITDNISLHPVNPLRGRSSRSAGFSLKEVARVCRTWFDWHPVLGAFALFVCVAIAVSALLLSFVTVIPAAAGSLIVSPLNGVVLAVVLVSRRKLWPFLLLGYTTALAGCSALVPFAPHFGSLELFGNVLELALAAFALPPYRNFKQWLQEPRLLPAFAGYALVLGPAIKALAAAAVYGVHAGFWERTRTIGLSESLGVALGNSFVLVLLNRQTYRLFRWRALPATLGLFALLLMTVWFSFSEATHTLFFLPCAVLIATAFLLGLRGTVLATASACALVLFLAARFPLSPSLVQGCLAIVVLTIFPLSVTLFNRAELEQRVKDYQSELDKLKSLDRLTGVANRKRFDLVLAREWQRATRDPKPMALLMIDIDYFDRYNELYGTHAGDECLRLIATKLAEQPHRQYDLVSRFQGGRFSVLLPGAAGDSVKRIAEQFRADIAALEWPHARSQFNRVTVSVGWATMLPDNDLKPNLLISAAEAGLASAKKKGRNRVEGFGNNVVAMTSPSR